MTESVERTDPTTRGVTTIPHDPDSERLLAGSALLRAGNARCVAEALDLDDIYDVTLRHVIKVCIDALDDIDRLTARSTVDDWAQLWPQTPPDTARVRAAAAAVLVDNLTLVVALGLLDRASYRPAGAVSRVQKAAAARRRLLELSTEADQILGEWRGAA